MKDGDLRRIFRSQLPSYQWTSVETAGTVSGVPDAEFCSPLGVQGWIEFKRTTIFHVQIKPFQVSWLMKRCRYAGRAWIAVRRHNNIADELWLMKGDQALALFNNGLTGVSAWCWEGGPSKWNFEEVDSIFSGFNS